MSFRFQQYWALIKNNEENHKISFYSLNKSDTVKWE